MTEQEWLTATDPEPMLEFLRGKACDRKLRLFTCACCRRVVHVIRDEQIRETVFVSESFADGEASEKSLDNECCLAECAQDYENLVREGAEEHAVLAIRSIGSILHIARVLDDTRQTMDKIARTKPELFVGVQPVVGYTLGYLVGERAKLTEAVQQMGLLRDIIGNPFRPITLDNSWLTPTVTRLAQAIYDERQLPAGLFDNQRMGVLADALEEVGCNYADILGHLRSGGEHVRGCWVVDLLLGKE